MLSLGASAPIVGEGGIVITKPVDVPVTTDGANMISAVLSLSPVFFVSIR